MGKFINATRKEAFDIGLKLREETRDRLARAIETINEHSRTISDLRVEVSRLQDTVTVLTNEVATLRRAAPRSPTGFRPLSDGALTLQPTAGEGVA